MRACDLLGIARMKGWEVRGCPLSAEDTDGTGLAGALVALEDGRMVGLTAGHQRPGHGANQEFVPDHAVERRVHGAQVIPQPEVQARLEIPLQAYEVILQRVVGPLLADHRDDEVDHRTLGSDDAVRLQPAGQ
jgi:hypothetical protein